MKKSFISIVLLVVFMLLPTVLFAYDEPELTLQEQVDNAESGATITLTEDVVLTERLLIPEGKTIILDLAGKTLTLPAVDNNYGMTIKGNLTITGNGTVNCNGLYGIGVATNEGSSLTIKNGTFNNQDGVYLIGSFGKTIIEGGTFNAGYCAANAFTGYASSVEAKAGTYTASASNALVVLGNTTVTGGTYNQDVKEYTPDGLTAVESNGSYAIVSKIGNPEVEIINGKTNLFANGTPITITEHANGALVSWNGGSIVVDSNAYIFGGMHNDETAVNTSITMNSGTVKVIMGGGLHKSNTVSSTVIMNGGTANVAGGGVGTGATTWVNCPCGESTESECKTTTSNVTINGGTTSLVYGGGCSGITTTTTTNVTITDGNHGYVIATGSNGTTNTANLNITNGTTETVVSNGNGKTNFAEVSVNGGKINTLVVFTDEPNKGVLGDVSVNVGSNAEVTTVTYGYNGEANAIDPTIGNITASAVKISSSATVGNISNLGNSFTTTHTVTINGKAYELVDGQTIKDISEYDSIINKEGYDFAGFVSNGSMFDPNTKITSSIKLETVFAPKSGPATSASATAETVKDDTPKTGIDNISLYVAILGTIALMGIAVIKK